MRIPFITKSTLLLLSVILISACATSNSGRTYSSTKNSISISNNKFQTCLNQIKNKEEYKNLLSKISRASSYEENAQPRVESAISKEDSILLREVFEEYRICENQKLRDYKKIDQSLYSLADQQFKTRENYFIGWLESPETTYNQISKEFEYLTKRESQQNALWAEYYTDSLKRQRTIEIENRARAAKELSEDIESIAGAFIDALIFLGNSQPTNAPVQPSLTLTEPVQQNSALQTTRDRQCPTGSYPWTDQWGNRICKDSISGTTTTITGSLESCPPGSFRWVDSFGTPICKSSTSSEEYYDTSKGCPFGTFLSTSEWGNPTCKKL